MSGKLKILVVDDSLISREWLIDMLPSAIKKRSEIYQASNGLEGVEQYKANFPDIVFLDITMPILDGFGALTQIKEINQNATVIMVTADRQKSTRKKLLDMGAIEIINKPIDEDEFREILYKVASS
jgi:two-component system chemotaxis response regulator CheY